MECAIGQGELIRLDGGKDGALLRCTGGTLWLTCGDGRDYLLSVGKNFMLAAGQTAVVEALETSDCTVGRPFSSRDVAQRPIIRLATC